ncbi:MBL fold metallo-hydrolase [Streptomyces griseiscabiei]|uniref:MBL fold metallo-hydrolase n=1 Tax=Streptomyces griseiscabiei TaxID=2993540 RepID=A0ABU4L4T5_9ACTN|nr:MBL fold metallo-hydrolase [Streptomyces griseiscabiei]MBZ3902036.1 MBL fold metallo-hydrolase [Streptomyces griseiscabiei]MDX2910762.1 MBL fold metallo-hydrolase [Streptomyces griseiscabiei]
MNGTVTVLDKGAVRIHSYMSPADTFHTTTQLIETAARIVAVDAQLLPAYADEVAAYARGLGKPLDRLIVTHAHPDHYNGAARFGVPVHALAEVREQILARGDSVLPTGPVIPVTDFTPDVVLVPGTEVIDGVPFVFEAVSGGEAADELLVRLPEQGVLVAQDLVYHDVHLYLGNNDIDGWQRAVDALAAEPGYDTILAGHGLPAGPEIYDGVRRYLTDARELLGDDGEAYKKAIVDRYPAHVGPFLIDIANRSLFGAEH